MTLADIDVWTENWLEQTGRSVGGDPAGNGHGGVPEGMEEYRVG